MTLQKTNDYIYNELKKNILTSDNKEQHKTNDTTKARLNILASYNTKSRFYLDIQVTP